MIIISQEVVLQVYLLSTVLYGTTIFPLEEELWALEPGLLVLSYAYDAAFDGLVQQNARLFTLLLEEGAHWEYLLYLVRSHFI